MSTQDNMFLVVIERKNFMVFSSKLIQDEVVHSYSTDNLVLLIE